jgi:hypothetical protein
MKFDQKSFNISTSQYKVSSIREKAYFTIYIVLRKEYLAFVVITDVVPAR